MKFLSHFLLVCGVWSLGSHSLANDKTILIEHQVTQEIAVDELSEQSDQHLPQLLWQNFTSMIQHFSQVYADIHKKNDELDISAEIQSVIQFPEHEVLGSLPACWIDGALDADGNGEMIFEIPSYWHRIPEQHEAGILDWNGLSGAVEFNHKFTAWEAEAEFNGVNIETFDHFSFEIDPSSFSANYSLNLDQNDKPTLEYMLDMPFLTYHDEHEEETVSIEYLQLSNTLLPEQYLLLGFNSTLDKFCYQKSMTGNDNELFNLFGFAAEFTARDTDTKFLNLPPRTNLVDLLNLEEDIDWEGLVNFMAFRPIELNVKFDQLRLHEAGFKSEQDCEKLPKDEQEKNTQLKKQLSTSYDDDLLHVEINDFEYNGRAAIQENGLSLENFYFSLGNSALQNLGFSTRFDYFKFAALSDLHKGKDGSPDLVEVSVNINANQFKSPQILEDNETLNMQLALSVKQIDADALLKLQQFFEQMAPKAYSEEAAMFDLALFSKYMEVMPNLIKQSPKIQLRGLDGDNFMLVLDENNRLSGNISVKLDGSDMSNFFSPQALINTLKAGVKVELKLTQDKANQLAAHFLETNKTEAAEINKQWAAMLGVEQKGETYTVKLDMDLIAGKLTGKNPTSKMIASALQPFLTLMGE